MAIMLHSCLHNRASRRITRTAVLHYTNLISEYLATAARDTLARPTGQFQLTPY
ncbi:hypothetical protein CY34DRAFT_803279 [Suillus luteus UH-Slu-Lm8-n1]|uniref:Uncharacterized protein n=1 Tax=Suillus luteus UH-Slu-Lm8-n1 TaxID=930992 RepID=A0A0D0B1P8_9AGAM|nr:hypothetical protein CY34DRAFT_803279 [Suillus luteus UH-Slu-Lm8-n1]